MSYRTYFAFTHTCFFEWTPDAKLPRCALPRAEIAVVIFVDAIGDIAQVMLFGQRLQLTEEFGFAEVAAVEIVGGIAFVLKLMRLQGNHGNTHLVCNCNSLASFFTGICRRRCYSTQSAVAQHIMRHFEQEGTVDPTRICNQHRLHVV